MATAKVKTHKRKGRVVKQHTRSVKGAGAPQAASTSSPKAGSEFKSIGEKMAHLRSLRGTKKSVTPKAKSTPKSTGGKATPKKVNKPSAPTA
jgi:hypothetical protein